MRPRTGKRHRGLFLLGLIAVLTTMGVAPVAASVVPGGDPAGVVLGRDPAGVASAAEFTVQQALDQGAEEARQSQGASTYATVVDRRTGKVVARTDNADTQVASESISKVLLAAYYLIRYRGNLPADIEPDLRRMIELSDDDLATAYWNDEAIPTVVKRYQLTGIEPASPDPGYWGGTPITADGMAEFLYKISEDPTVGPWLIAAMKNTTDYGIDGYDQNFGFNILDGVASKQGWGSDNDIFDPSEPNAVHSIGLTRNYAAAVLQSGPGGTYRSLGSAITNTVQLVQQADVPAAPAPDPNSTPSTAKPTTARPTPAKPTADDPSSVNDPAGWWRRALMF